LPAYFLPVALFNWYCSLQNKGCINCTDREIVTKPTWTKRAPTS